MGYPNDSLILLSLMNRYFLEFAYNGKAYNGWQSQPNAIGVQQKIEEALFTLFRENISLTGAGRTDTGVHAAQMFAHFDTAFPLFSGSEKWLYKLNRILPDDIGIYRIIPVNSDAHARFHAISRTYQYHFITRKDPFYADTAWLLYREPDWKRMAEAASFLTGYSDFEAFSKSHAGHKTSLCRVTEAQFVFSPHHIVFQITADRFLRNMVRAIVGTLVEIGNGQRSLESIREIMESRDRKKAGASAPAHGLTLFRIQYPESVF